MNKTAPKPPARSGPLWYKSWENWKRILEVAAVISAVAYSILTYLMWRDAHKNFIADERAWVATRGFTVTAEPGQGEDARLRVFVQNNGRTPAFDVRTQDLFGFGTQTPECFKWSSKDDAGPGSIVSPNVPDAPYHETPTLDVPPGQLAQYKARNAHLYFLGMHQYRDIFGEAHWLQFCALHDYGMPLTQFAYCGGCNDSDH